MRHWTSTRWIWVTIAVALASTTAIAGCGGSGGDPSAVVMTYLSAYLKGDGKTACDQLTQAATLKLAEAGQQAGLGSTCSEVVSSSRAELGGQSEQALKSAKVTSGTVTGDSATVQVITVKKTATAYLSQVGGRWYINDLGALSNTSSGAPTPTTPAPPPVK